MAFCHCLFLSGRCQLSSQNMYYEERKFTNDDLELILSLKSAEFENCQFLSLDLTMLNMSKHKYVDCLFEKCNMNNLNLKNSNFRDVKFLQCKLLGINWCACQLLSNPNFMECQLDYSVFQKINLSKTIFDSSSLKEADFSETNLVKASLRNTMLDGAVFTNANLSEADLREAKNYSIDARTTKIKKAKFSMPDVMALLEILDITIE